MAKIIVSENKEDASNISYLKKEIFELIKNSGSIVSDKKIDGCSVLGLEIQDYYKDIVLLEVCDRVAEIIVINYKYNYFKNTIKVCGLNEKEKEILYASLIAADLEDDKKYVFDRIKGNEILSIDGIYNFRLNALKRKWEDVVSYVPTMFINSQLKDFITYLIENKNKKVYIDNGKVYDSHYRRLYKSDLLGGIEDNKIIKEVLLSNCGIVNLTGNISKDDEFYLKEYYGANVVFNSDFFSWKFIFLKLYKNLDKKIKLV